ncbi:hypothetical protein LCGC14_1173940 [marine sediment metagenome]|uniref:Uncharacterized protein n=1 Tax=marine sediment metagenome TaxID=412755 RepID=A0A0F9LTY9_9ZZZZ
MPNVNIEVSILLSTQDFKIIGDIEYNKFGDGICAEGHPIKYGIEVEDEHKNIYVFGNQCIAKPFILKQWKLKLKMLDDPDVMKAGRYLWIIARDGLENWVDNIPHPKDLNWDFKKLKEKLKTIVLNAKKTKRVNLKEIMKQEKMKIWIEDFKATHKEQCKLMDDLVIKIKRLKDNNVLGILNDFYRGFVVSIVGQHRELKTLSKRQMIIIKKILQLKEESEVKGSLDDKITMAVDMIENLGEWDKKFIFSIQSQFYEGRELSKKQKNKLDELLEKNKQFKEFIGKDMTTWITEQKVGDTGGFHGVIKSVKAMAKSGKAILAVFEVNYNEYEAWIPVSQIE